ncbi:MAG: hypothetical protein ACR2RA_05280 [Geminicoccaceae bacterium]
MTPEEIDQAVAKGIITPGQALELKAEASKQDPGVEEEPFAFVDNFGAVFVVVGLVILQGAPWLFSTVLGGLAAPLLYGGFAAIYWILAEGFVRGKRRLPATASTLLFVYDGAIAGQLFIGQLLGSASEFSQFAAADTGLLALAALLLAIALWRFRLPLLVLGLALSLVALALSLMNAPTLWIMGACGLTAILLGILLDLKDPTRTGAWHEWAMWLFVVGSPLAVHPLFVTVIRDRVEGRGLSEVFDGGGTIALVIGLAFAVSFVGLLLDRRSLVTSSLIYLAGAFAYLLFRTVGDPISLLGVIPLTIGAYVILLGVAWKPIRRVILSGLPGQEILRRLPRY